MEERDSGVMRRSEKAGQWYMVGKWDSGAMRQWMRGTVGPWDGGEERQWTVEQ